VGNQYLKVRGPGNKNWVRCARFCVSGTNYHICIRCVYIRQLHVIVSPKLFSKKFEKDAQCLNKSKTKIVPTEFYFTNISLNSYFLALGPSNIDFPPQFTPEIDIQSFFQFPVPPCQAFSFSISQVIQEIMKMYQTFKRFCCLLYIYTQYFHYVHVL